MQLPFFFLLLQLFEILLVVFVPQLQKCFGLLFGFLNLFERSLFLDFQHSHSVFQKVDVFLHLQTDRPGLVICEVFRFQVDDLVFRRRSSIVALSLLRPRLERLVVRRFRIEVVNALFTCIDISLLKPIGGRQPCPTVIIDILGLLVIQPRTCVIGHHS